MSGARNDLRSWSRRQWGTVVGLVTVLQLGLLVVLVERTAEVPSRVAAPPELRIIAWESKGVSGREALEVLDPALFAVPGPRSFSGAAWDRPRRSPTAPSGWQEDPRWLTAQTQWFGRVTALTEVKAMSRLATGEEFIPAPRVVEPPPIPLATGSRVVLDAGLMERGWVTPLVAPLLVHSNLVNRTEIEVSVEPDGWVFSAVVVRSSGLARADEEALALALAARFTPLPGAGGPVSERQWGKLRIDWRTVSPERESGAGSGVP